MADSSAAEDWEQAAAQLDSLAIEDDSERGQDATGPADGPAEQQAAPAASAAEVHVDHALRDALAHPKNRVAVLRLETEVEAFVVNSEEVQHVFSSDMSSYERLLAHRTAQHWGLETSTLNHGPDQGRIVAVRTAGTRAPQVKLADVPVTMVDSAAAGGQPGGAAGSPPAPRVLVRKRAERGPRGMMGGPGMEGAYGMSNANGQYRSVQEREQEYHRARARIFGEGAGGPGGYGGGPGGAPPPPPRGGPMNGGAGMMGGVASPFAGMMGPMSPQLSAGMGYGAGIGRPGMPAGMYGGGPPGAGYGGAVPGSYGGAAPGGYGGAGGYGGGPGGPRPTKAQLRNKEADLADPDFRRGRGLHGPRFDPGFGEEAQAGASVYLRPTYGSEFPELPSSGGSSGAEGRSSGGRPAQSPRSNGGAGGVMGGMAASPVQGSPAAAAAAMYGPGYASQMSGMSPQDMMAMQAAYGYGQGMVPAGTMMTPMPGMMYPSGGSGGMPYGVMAMPYGYMPMRPGQQEAMMQAYAAGMQMAYGPYPAAAAAGGMQMQMPMSPVSGMQNPMSPGAIGLGRPRSGRYSGRNSNGGQRSAAHTPRADGSGAERQHSLQQGAPVVAAAAAAQQAQQGGQQQQQQEQTEQQVAAAAAADAAPAQ